MEIFSELVMNTGSNTIDIPTVQSDSAEREQAEEKLRQSEEKYRTLIENSQDGIFIIQDAKMQFANEAFARMVGCNIEQVIGETFQKFIAPEDLEMVADRYRRRQLGEDVPKEYEFRMLHKDGKTRIVVIMNVGIINYCGRVASMGTVKDITENKRLWNELSQSEGRYRNLVENAKDIIFNISVEGTINSLNPSFEKITGWLRSEWIGKPFMPLVHPRDLSFAIRVYQRALSGESSFELGILSKAGEYVMMDFITTPQYQDGKVVGILGIARDITERKKADELRLENGRLAYVSKAKSEFLANMSHELRTPLNAIIGFSELMKEKIPGELNEKQDIFLGHILAASNHLLEIINDILDLSKVEAGKVELEIEKISLPETINNIHIMVREKAAKNNIIINMDLEPRLEFIEADRLRTKQILFNLLNNAIKFSKPEGGLITIKSEKKEDMAQISISDNGIGIRDEEIEKLFNEFEQLDSGITRKYGGTGLGLAITKKLVELQGGKIIVESRFGEGSTFTFLLPLKGK